MSEVVTDKDIKGLVKKYLVYIHRWTNDPVTMVMDLALATILPYQADGLRSVAKNKRTIIRSGHGVGKTFFMAIAAVWWMLTHWRKGEGCSIIVTSPASSQLLTTFWPQFTSIIDLLPRFLRTQFTVNTENAYCTADQFAWRIDLRTARKENPDALAGQHNVLFLVDEWSGVDEEIYTVIEGAMSDAGSRILAIGNPVRPLGWGYDAFGRNKKLWHTIHVNCEEWPAGTFFETEYLSPTGETLIMRAEGRCDPKEFKKWLDLDGGDRDGARYRVRVRGEFPRGGSMQLISHKLAEPCLGRVVSDEEVEGHYDVLSLDPATTGEDDIAFIHRKGRKLKMINTWQEDDSMTIVKQVLHIISSDLAGIKFKYLYIDAIGEGKGILDRFREIQNDPGHPHYETMQNIEAVIAYKSSETSPDDTYHRMRDYSWAKKAKNWLRNDKPSFPRGEYEDKSKLLIQELTTPTFSFTDTSKEKVESKKQLKSKGHASPNIADAVIMSLTYNDVIPAKNKGRDLWAESQMQQAAHWKVL